MKTAILALALVAQSCVLLPFGSVWLEVRVEHGGTRGWALAPGGVATLNNLLTDQAGLAGIEIEVLGTGQEVALTASDLGDGTSRRFGGVPDSGPATVVTRLRQDGELVAEGSGEWMLEPDTDGWEIAISRAPYAWSVVDVENPSCRFSWCRGLWKFPIREDAANYPGEALWVTVEWVGGSGGEF